MDQPTDHATPPTSPAKGRTTIITVLCIWSFIGNFTYLGKLGIPSVREAIIQQYGILVLYHDFLACSLALIALAGFWEMRRWGVYLYTTAIISAIVCGLIVGTPTYMFIYSKIIPITMIYIGFSNLKKMT